jgi:8-oxo-dGTP pyrophosphatase MutT (NUDIX family)
MFDGWPKIRSRRTTSVSPWVALIEREVEFVPGGAVETYHAVGQLDYVSIVAVTPGHQIPIVRQFRPALESFTWELPAGLVDPGEDATATCRRELLEETGLSARVVKPLGVASPDTGRLSNRIHSFFVETGDPVPGFKPEPGLTVKLVSPAELVRLIAAGEFVSHLHLGALMLAQLNSRLNLK